KRQARASSYGCLTDRLVLHNDRGSDAHAAIEIDHVLIRHAEAAGRYCLSDRLRLVGAVNAVEGRTEIERTRPERVLDTAGHVAGQVGPASAHLRGRRPARPFALGADAVHAAPAEAVAPDADAVAQGRAARLHEVEPPLGGVDDNRARRVIAGIVDAGAGNRADAATAVEAVTAAEEVGVAAHHVG